MNKVFEEIVGALLKVILGLIVRLITRLVILAVAEALIRYFNLTRWYALAYIPLGIVGGMLTNRFVLSHLDATGDLSILLTPTGFILIMLVTALLHPIITAGASDQMPPDLRKPE